MYPLSNTAENPCDVCAYAQRVHNDACEALEVPLGVLSVEGKTCGGRVDARVGSAKELEWGAPEEGWVKVNVDASVKEECGVGLGLVGRDHNGEIVMCGSRSWTWNFAVDEAEALAVR